MLATLQALGVMPSFSRPAVSNDNPYSESLFKTLKYRPNYSSRAFESLLAARQWVGTFVHWYNHEHRHTDIGPHTAADVHYGLAAAKATDRAATLTVARAANPERFTSSTPPKILHLPGAAWINSPLPAEPFLQTEGRIFG